MHWASQKRESLRDAWEAGELSAAFNTEMIVKNAGATGACSVYKEIENLDVSDLFEDTK